jgi:DNA processing protein
MKKKEILWFRLFNAGGFGPKGIHYIYNVLQKKHRTIEDLFALDETAFSDMFPEIGHGKFSKATFGNILQTETDNRLHAAFEALEKANVNVIGLDDELYPQHVLNILNGSSPVVLFCRGNLRLLHNKSISIVGARQVDDSVEVRAKEIAKNLSNAGYNIVSGYAKGVDTSAHVGALEADGTTTMILSFGVNHISIKKEMKDLAWEKNGLFVTQFAPFEKFSGQNAMARNKLVCAMSKAVIVMQSGPERDTEGKMSGTFDAGKSALELGIPVFVLSPKILPYSIGNQDLIKRGGIEFENSGQIISYLENAENGVEKNEHQLLNGLNPKQGSKIANQLTLF